MTGNNAHKYRLTWLSNLEPLAQTRTERKTGIICTLGPATNTSAGISALRKAGMNIARLNFSHGTHAYHAATVQAVRTSVEDFVGRPIAIALDTKGPEIRLGDLEVSSGFEVGEGAEVRLTTDPKYQAAGNPFTHGVFVDYPTLGSTVAAGQPIYVDDGNLTLVVKSISKEGDYVVTQANNAHVLLGRKGVNLPDCALDLPPVSEKDKQDLRFAVEHRLDIVFASFIRRASDIHAIRNVLGADGAHIQVIAKIENSEGVRNFDEILKVADGIMVARGDLGIEIPPENVFLAQKWMIAKCNLAGKAVICATQMLESMTVNPRPTRAEASDVANAVLDGVDCVMLSGETAKGRYPTETVAMMHRICIEAESAIAYAPLYEELCALAHPVEDVGETVAMAAVSASLQSFVQAIIVLTTTGSTARLVAKYRPQVSIIAVTRTAHVARQLHLYRGCFPFYYAADSQAASPMKVHKSDPTQWQHDVDRRFYWAMDEAKEVGLLKPGDFVVVLQGSKGGHGNTNTLKIIPVPE